MTTQTQTDNEILNAILKVATDYGVKHTEETAYPKQITICYEISGQGSAISQRINDLMEAQYPKQNYRIKIIPSDRKMIFSLF